MLGVGWWVHSRWKRAGVLRGPGDGRAAARELWSSDDKLRASSTRSLVGKRWSLIGVGVSVDRRWRRLRGARRRAELRVGLWLCKEMCASMSPVAGRRGQWSYSRGRPNCWVARR